MSIHRSYFSRNNTLLNNSFTNTGKAPYTELYFGSANDVISKYGFSRFIFDLDLTELINKFSDGTISTGCTGFSGISHKLVMTNTSSFDKELMNGQIWDGRIRATSFDLNLIRIPKTSGNTGNPQTWDNGVGSDYYDVKNTQNFSNGLIFYNLNQSNQYLSQAESKGLQATQVLSVASLVYLVNVFDAIYSKSNDEVSIKPGFQFYSDYKLQSVSPYTPLNSQFDIGLKWNF